MINGYCKKHSNSKNILRIDNPLPKKYINKLMDLLTENKTNKNKDDYYKIRIYNGEIIKTSIENDHEYKYKPNKTFETDYKNKFNGLKIEEIIDLISGPAYNNPLLSHNNIDPISQEEIWDIKDGQKIISNEIKQIMLFSFEDEQKFVHCFNIDSLRNLFKHNNFNHPITGKEFPNHVIENAKIKIDILEDLGELEIHVKDTELTEDMVKNYTFTVFANFHKFNIYPNDIWFLDLSLEQLGKMYYETKDFFQQNIDFNQKKILVPPNGIAFVHESNYIKNCKNKLYVQYYLLDNINKIISLCSNEALQIMGAYIAIGGLATVSVQAREGYPHIAYSFM
jgi:uncharacterized protein YciU (UPF0263 family)